MGSLCIQHFAPVTVTGTFSCNHPFTLATVFGSFSNERRSAGTGAPSNAQHFAPVTTTGAFSCNHRYALTTTAAAIHCQGHAYAPTFTNACGYPLTHLPATASTNDHCSARIRAHPLQRRRLVASAPTYRRLRFPPSPAPHRARLHQRPLLLVAHYYSSSTRIAFDVCLYLYLHRHTRTRQNRSTAPSGCQYPCHYYNPRTFATTSR